MQWHNRYHSTCSSYARRIQFHTRAHTHPLHMHIIHYSNRKTIRSRLYLAFMSTIHYSFHFASHLPSCKHTHSEWQMPSECGYGYRSVRLVCLPLVNRSTEICSHSCCVCVCVRFGMVALLFVCILICCFWYFYSVYCLVILHLLQLAFAIVRIGAAHFQWPFFTYRV